MAFAGLVLQINAVHFQLAGGAVKQESKRTLEYDY